MSQSSRIGVDVGGTFTDTVAVANGRVHVRKVPSTLDAPEEGVLVGLEEGLGEIVDPGDVEMLAHGTTVATNALLEGDWAEAVLVTTQGFQDVLEIGRQDRPSLYDLSATKPEPIVPRDRRFGIEERLDERGDVQVSLRNEEIDDVAESVRASDADAVAIALLFGYENDEHEVALERGLRDRGVEVPISRSSAVHPEIREYERTLVTAVNAALQPVVSAYLERLSERLTAHGLTAGLTMMQSNGGTADAERLVERPVRGLLSGPAAGVQGAAHAAEQVGETDVITMDMGGTSCDVSLVVDSEPSVSTDVTVGPYPIAVPMVDIHTIGAGGGSIAWLDAGDALRVGPRSAGAQPGPICYGRGGTEPTVTDAQALLGRLDPAQIVTENSVDRQTVESQLRSGLAAPMGSDVHSAAAGVIEVAEAAMARAVRVVSVERGHDPREFALIAYGGAGPLHAPQVAALLDIPRVIVPPAAGVLSAVGLLVADRIYDFARSKVRPIADVDSASIESTVGDFADRGRSRLRAEGLERDRIAMEASLDLRYLGQAYEVEVPIAGPLSDLDLDAVVTGFHERHERRFGHSAADEPVELVTIRLRARGLVDPPALMEPAVANGSLAEAERERREVFFDGEAIETPVYTRAALPADSSFAGPAIVEGEGSTLVVPPGQEAHVHSTASIVVEVVP